MKDSIKNAGVDDQLADDEDDSKKKDDDMVEVVDGEGRVHRKKRRRNVPTADAQTQTDRSDYMIIK